MSGILGDVSMCNKRHVSSSVRWCFTLLRRCNMHIIYFNIKRASYFKFMATHYSNSPGTSLSVYVTEQNKTKGYFNDKRRVTSLVRPRCGRLVALPDEIRAFSRRHTLNTIRKVSVRSVKVIVAFNPKLGLQR